MNGGPPKPDTLRLDDAVATRDGSEQSVGGGGKAGGKDGGGIIDGVDAVGGPKTWQVALPLPFETRN